MLALFRKPEEQILQTTKAFGKVKDTLHFHRKRKTFRSAKLNYLLLSHGSRVSFCINPYMGTGIQIL